MFSFSQGQDIFQGCRGCSKDLARAAEMQHRERRFRMCGKKIPHDSRGIRAVWVGKGSGARRATSAPGMAQAINQIFLHYHLLFGRVGRDDVGVAARRPAGLNAVRYSSDGVVRQAIIGVIIEASELLNYLLTVDGSHPIVPCPMENNHRENTRRRSGTRIGQLPLQIRIWTAPDLSYTGAGDAACSTVLKPAMDTYRGEIIGIANPHDNCHCPACRHPGEKDPGGIDGILRTNLIHHPGEYGRLPTPALLIEGIIPAPTSARVRSE